jgi:GrpB-like predicted nucleotidyltransferase (UPF0157 family)
MSERRAHIHVDGHPDAWEQMVFRDYLCDHPDVADDYSSLKERLASENTRGTVEYLEGKDGFIKGIMATAISEGYAAPYQSQV